MDDLVTLLIWVVGLVVAVVLIVAQCQLFAIRRAVEALVKLQLSGSTAAASMTPVSPSPAASLPEEGAGPRVIVAIAVVVIVCLVVLALTIWARH